MPQLEFDIWGSIPFSPELTSDDTVQQILLATRTESRSISEIAHAAGADKQHVKEKIDELTRYDLLVPDESCPGKWLANLPIYTEAELTASEQIGCKYAGIEADILRSSLPGLLELYESCEIAGRFPWESMSLVIVGALVADLCDYDRVRFFPQHLSDDFLPPLHPDGTRWEYVGYEKRSPRFQHKRWAFYHNLDVDEPEVGGLATFGYFDPPAQRQPRPKALFDSSLRAMVFRLAEAPMSIDEMAAASSLSADDLREMLEGWTACDPSPVSAENGRYSLAIPILPYSDLRKLVDLGDAIAETIHTKVTVPWHKERQGAARQMGLRFPLAEGFLARDIALGQLVEEGCLSPVADPPVPWDFGVWGWHGTLPLWEDATREKEGA